ncbi:GyrI-like domain-containing protein [Namhaeicola litoreus]|uniref:GyrI-like domain-containing protein n=1 Tax=Namhaeicola litoreus TaxID=1052145 RepID=A0ABW3XXB5_9FLAO
MIKPCSITVVELSSTALVGMKMNTNLQKNEAVSLWKKFKPRVKEISNRKDDRFYSLQNYHHFDPIQFTSETDFDRWAAVEVEKIGQIPEGMESILIPQGSYATFVHTGTVMDFSKALFYFFSQWLPDSDYVLENHPHFEVFDHRYLGPHNPNSIEDVFIPIKLKAN